MKNSTIFCALIAVVMGAQFINARIVSESPQGVETSDENRPCPGMYFSSENVVEEYEYDDAYCIVYDDADANLFETEICLDLESYQLVVESRKNGDVLTGTLVLSEDYAVDGAEVYTIVSEEEGMQLVVDSLCYRYVKIECLTR